MSSSLCRKPSECVELVDDVFMSAINKYGISSISSSTSKSKPAPYPERDSLFFKFQGPTPTSLAESAAITKKIVERHGGQGFRLARDDKEAESLWSDRKNAHYAGLALVDGAKGWPTDVWYEIFHIRRRLDCLFSIFCYIAFRYPTSHF